MRETSIYPSLLSYLLPEHSKYCLLLLKSKSFNSTVTPSPSPFTLLNDNDPLAKTFRGAFVTDYGSIIKEVNLLIQRDTIEWPVDQENLLTNSIVDQYWQQAMSTRLNRTPEHSMLLAAQVGEQQQLLAFTSLFYCREKETFFEPPCPACGQTLKLCKDDDLLDANDLSPYTTSLRRYLFCASCYQMNDHHLFYSFERKADDPSTVHDCRQLILDFNKLGSDTDENCNLPCVTCQQQKFCYGNNPTILDNIFTLSFYPFYMLISECDSMDGFHLLTLLRGDISRTNSFPIDTTPAKGKENNHDRKIHTIIRTLAKNWQQEAMAPKEDISSEKHTISTGSETLTSTLPMGINRTDEDLTQETIIMNSPGKHSSDKTESLHTETVLLSGKTDIQEQTHYPPQTSQPTKNKPSVEDDELAETIIIKPGKKT